MIPLMRNTFINEFETKKALSEFILRTNKLSMDVKCMEFEREFAKFQGRNDAILFNSGGSANIALLQALKNLDKLKDSDNIGFSALTWSTNVMPIIQIGFKPVAIDCELKTINVMSNNVVECLNETRLNALFITNVLGLCGDLDNIKKICEEKEIILIEDNCESLGTETKEGKTGNFGVASTFSFFVAHHMSTIEGGMICTDDYKLSEMLRIVRANGWDRNLSSLQQAKLRNRYGISSEFEAKYTFYDLGFNMRPTEITGFLGLQQLKYINENIKIRESNYLKIEQTIKQNDDFLILNRDHIKTLSSFALPFVCKTPEIRKKYIEQFSGAGIEIRPLIAGNIQRQPFYNKYVKHLRNLPGADYLNDSAFYCGNYPDLTESDIEVISSCLMRY